MESTVCIRNRDPTGFSRLKSMINALSVAIKLSFKDLIEYQSIEGGFDILAYKKTSMMLRQLNALKLFLIHRPYKVYDK
jgi:hypothetical protein